MATVINNPNGTADGSSMGMVLGIIVALLVIALLVFFAVPALRSGSSSGNSVNVPDKVDVNLNSGGQSAQ